MNILKQSTAATIKLGPFVDDTDGKTAETALTIGQADIRLSKNGGDIAQTNNATGATHDELGYYTVALSATDTNTLGSLKVMVSKEGALPVWADFMVVTPMIYDVMCGAGNLTGVKLDGTQGAITWGQQKIIANVEEEGALHIVNTNSDGYGQYNKGGEIGQKNSGDFVGQQNHTPSSDGYGQQNFNDGMTHPVFGFDPEIKTGLANQDLLQAFGDLIYTAIGGDDWDGETLKAIYDVIDAIKAKTDNLPASPAAVGSLMNLADGAITDAKIASNAISAAKIASNAIAGAKIATDAVTKIQTGLSTADNLAIVDGLIDTLIARLTETRAGNLDKLAIGAGNTLAHTGNANTFKADVSALAKTTDLSPLAKETNATANKNDIEAILTAIKGAGWTDETLKAIMEAVEAIGGGSGGDTAEQIWAYANRTLTASPTDISTLAKTSDLTPLAKTSDLANVAKKTDIPTDYAKKTDVPTVAQNQNGLAKTTDLSGLAKTTDLSGLATEANATANKNEIKTAIADKPVTPATNIDNLPTKTDIETAKDAIIGAMPELDTSQLEGKLDDVKGKTDQLQFTAGKVNANATVDLGTSDIAKQSTSEQILAMFAEAQIAIIGNVQDGKITAIRGNDWELVIPCELPDDAKIQMAVKSNAGMRDDQSAIFLDSTTGLIYLDKDNGNAADGSLVYANGNLTLTLTAAATAKLCAGNYRYGIQSVSQAGKVTEKYQGDFLISNDIVKATS